MTIDIIIQLLTDHGFAIGYLGEAATHLQRHTHTRMGDQPHQGEEMTDIKDLELRIKSAESTLEMLRGELEELRQQQQPEPESLFGRWATHPDYGRGIITSIKPDSNGEVRFAYRNSFYTYGVDALFVRVDDLTIDPATLNTADDFDKAPEGTIVEATTELHDVYLKCQSYWLVAGDIEEANHTTFPPCRVIRWGNGK